MSHERLISSWTLTQIAEAAGGDLIAGEPASHVHAVGSDSRVIGEGDLFVALVGERFDGHDFLAQVAGEGAAAALVSRRPDSPPEGLALILVEDTLAAFQRLGLAVWREALEGGLHAVALTGSNGKTTTKELLRALWSTRGQTYATHGNYNNHVGVPLTTTNLPADAEYAVIEMGANAPGDIGELIALAPSPVRIITSIGHAHIEGFGGIDGVRRTKREIFNDPDAGTVAIAPFAERDNLVADDFPGRVITFGAEPEADVRVESLGVAPEGGARLRVTFEAQQITCTSPLYGVHNATNLAAALATFWGSGVALDEARVAEGLARVELPGGRWRRVDVEGLIFLDDAYNANPSSVLASFDAFALWQRGLDHEGPRVAIIGEMLELGEGAKNWHIDVARSIAGEGDLSTLICVGDFAESMAEAAREARAEDAGFEAVAAQDVAAAARAVAALERGVIFLKASRGARLERVISLVQDGRGRGAGAD